MPEATTLCSPMLRIDGLMNCMRQQLCVPWRCMQACTVLQHWLFCLMAFRVHICCCH